MSAEYEKQPLTPEMNLIFASMEAMWKEAMRNYIEAGVPAAEAMLRSMYPTPEILWRQQDAKELVDS